MECGAYTKPEDFFDDKDKRIKEVEAEVEELKSRLKHYQEVINDYAECTSERGKLRSALEKIGELFPICCEDCLLADAWEIAEQALKE